jgi:parvulin-like peptidyl-prolyl isomerase
MSSPRFLGAAYRAAALAVVTVTALLALRPTPGGAGSGGSDVVAKVGDRVITREQWEAEFARQHLPPGANADSLRQKFLESLVQKELLVLEAKARGYYDGPQVKVGIAKFADRQLQDRMKSDEIRADSTISDAEINALFERSKTQRKISHIMHWSAASIDTVRRRIDAGEPFEKVAADMTIDAQAAEAGGALPWLNDSVFPDEFHAVLDTLRLGGVGGPFRSRLGYHVVRQDSTRAREGANLETERPQVREGILAIRSRDHRWQMIEGYKQRYRFQLDTTATAQTVSEAALAYSSAAGDTSMRMVPMSGRWIARDSTQVLARYASATITTADYRTYLLEGGYTALYARLGPAQAINDVSELFCQRARVLEAKRLGYDKDPDIVRRIELKREELAVDQLYDAEVASKIKYTDTDGKVYYAAHKDQFPRREFYRCALMNVDDASVAQGIVEKIGGLDAAGFDSLKAEVDRTGHLIVGLRDTGRRWAEEGDPILDAARTMKPGEVGHVIDTRAPRSDREPPGGEPTARTAPIHSVFVLIEHQPAGDQTFEEAEETVKRTLYNIQSEELLTTLLDQLQSRYPVEKHPENLSEPKG